MKTTVHPSELSSLVERLNLEIHEHFINTLSATAGPAYAVSWTKVCEEVRLEIRTDTKLVKILPIVIPVQIVDGFSISLPLSGARLEVVGAWRIDTDSPWLCNQCFGDAGRLMLVFPSYEPEHIKSGSIALAAAIGKYLDAQITVC